MPQIIPIKDLKNTSEISDMCHRAEEPIYITKNGYGDMVIMSMEIYESAMKQLAMYRDIEISEKQIEAGQVKDARTALLDGIDGIYDRLETNLFQFPLSREAYLANKGYHEAVVPQMDYIVIFDVREDTVNVVGVFHQLENYQSKL